MIPEIRMDRGIPTLYVNDKPFFARCGELHNSSSSSLEYMEEHVWPNLKDLHMNSVIAPIYWELIEPLEGEFRFELLDGLIRQAREHDMKLILIWFGLWKNSESMYVPGWMKQDTQTYFHARTVSGKTINTISPLCGEAVEKDSRAFRKVMAHIREVDEQEQTVITMQVENEIGLMGTAGDYSAAAQELFQAELPGDMAELYQTKGTWKEAFGEDAEEYFMAYHFAAAIEKVTAAGREEYPLPCYVNVWLRQYPWYAGSYPSGGPVDKVHPIWKMKAPSLFTIGPDIYVPYAPQTMEAYSYEGNPLFIPEIRKDAVTSSYCLHALTKYNAICYSPFGIEDLALDPDSIDKPSMEVMAALNIDPAAIDITNSHDYLAATYQLLENMEPLYLKYRGSGHMQSFLRQSNTDFGTFLNFEKYNIQVAYAPIAMARPWASGVIFELDPDHFLALGMMCSIRFIPKNGENCETDYIKIEEGTLKNGEWIPGRVLNGDEKMNYRFGDFPACYMIEPCKF